MDEKVVRERSLLDQQEVLRKESFKLEIVVPLPYNVLVNFSFHDIVLLKTKHCKLNLCILLYYFRVLKKQWNQGNNLQDHYLFHYKKHLHR